MGSLRLVSSSRHDNDMLLLLCLCVFPNDCRRMAFLPLYLSRVAHARALLRKHTIPAEGTLFCVKCMSSWVRETALLFSSMAVRSPLRHVDCWLPLSRPLSG